MWTGGASRSRTSSRASRSTSRTTSTAAWMRTRPTGCVPPAVPSRPLAPPGCSPALARRFPPDCLAVAPPVRHPPQPALLTPLRPSLRPAFPVPCPAPPPAPAGLCPWPRTPPTRGPPGLRRCARTPTTSTASEP
jgi:hypothetical protein